MTLRDAVKRVLRPLVPVPILMARHRNRQLRGRMQALEAWEERGWAAPSPPFVKRTVLRRYSLPSATWIETGTFRGDTTAFLASFARKVVTIEPEPAFFARARDRFCDEEAVEVVHGLSEVVLPLLLPSVRGPVCFWLDGHYSSPGTFRGPLETPVLEELAAIEASIDRFDGVVVLIDDIRNFAGTTAKASYPSLDLVVDWSRRNRMQWHVEHDILIARRD